MAMLTRTHRFLATHLVLLRTGKGFAYPVASKNSSLGARGDKTSSSSTTTTTTRSYFQIFTVAWQYLDHRTTRSIRAASRDGRLLHDSLTTCLDLYLGTRGGTYQEPAADDLSRFIGAVCGRGAQINAVKLHMEDVDDDSSTATLREQQLLCDCRAVEDEMHVFVECPAYASTRAKYERDLALQGRNMRTIMTAAPPLALARFLSEVWETRHVALRRFVLKRTREDDDGPPRVQQLTKVVLKLNNDVDVRQQPGGMMPPAAASAAATAAGLVIEDDSRALRLTFTPLDFLAGVEAAAALGVQQQVIVTRGPQLSPAAVSAFLAAVQLLLAAASRLLLLPPKHAAGPGADDSAVGAADSATMAGRAVSPAGAGHSSWLFALGLMPLRKLYLHKIFLCKQDVVTLVTRLPCLMVGAMELDLTGSAFPPEALSELAALKQLSALHFTWAAGEADYTSWGVREVVEGALMTFSLGAPSLETVLVQQPPGPSPHAAKLRPIVEVVQLMLGARGSQVQFQVR
ncbi:hypothetical protein VOLCADRAFT_96704 [Volvox carteri f. nagariensis]|uniref:Uncharacterized protein n=1 Tax=Volvox carteri f. nagariensis TaxID=3068 RepID=D8UAU4_VOLCA|nr:uncharacterized protein VOLCADRAFT_96704 [Volvox carteri f. nagariensis]EFJ43161.1 hypothetical protein VOLCADRAFT_96704 [Volvox carteri f. nagariensis]|eukprot:XP_002955736.1 hypothetical protein VOLCADRAFT_96704 [Volvox carteri f. nagariensis]